MVCFLEAVAVAVAALVAMICTDPGSDGGGGVPFWDAFQTPTIILSAIAVLFATAWSPDGQR